MTRPEQSIRVVVVGLVAAIGVGVACVIYGGADDAPGLQGIGLLVIVGAVALTVRRVRNRRPS